MARAAAKEASNIYNTSSGNANNLFGQLQGQANSLVNSQGFDPATMAAITNAGMGGVNAAAGDAANQIKRNAAVTKNTAGIGGQLDTLAMNKGLAGGQEAGNIQMANYGEKQRQRDLGLNLLSSMYGANMGQEVPAVNAQTAASPGWAQTLFGSGGVLGGIGGLMTGGAALKHA